MVEAPRRKKLSRFTPWTNRLELEEDKQTKVVDVRKQITRTEFRDAGPITRTFEAKVLQTARPVTNGFHERRKRDPIFDAFGIGKSDQDVRGNAHITMVHRDNVWHPYYEVKMEEEDLGTKLRNRKAEKKEKETEGEEIASLQTALLDLERNQREENEQREQAASGAPKKRVFDAKAFMEKKKANEEAEADKKELDPCGIRLSDIPAITTEDELRQAIVEKGWGQIARLFMPPAKQPKKSLFAICTFTEPAAAERALNDEITVNFGDLII